MADKDKKENNFTGLWIPKEIWEDKRLTLTERAILALIVNLDTGDGCFARNTWIADFCGCGRRTAERAVKKLVDYGLIERMDSCGKKRKIKQTNPAKMADQPRQNGEDNASNWRGNPAKMADQPRQNGDHNKSCNNIYNNISILCAGVLEKLSARTGKAFPADEATLNLIGKRLLEGYTQSDLETVIDKKCAEWMGTEWEYYLRPSTLFGDKFPQYLTAPARYGPRGQTTTAGSFDTDEFFNAALRRTERMFEEQQNKEKEKR